MLMKLPCIGIDVSKEWFDACSHDFKLKDRFKNTVEGMKLLLKRLRRHGIKQARFCMEATGLYFEQLAEFLHTQGFEVVVVNPQCIKSYARSELRRSKSDPLDADLIATYCEDKYARLTLWSPLPVEHVRVRNIIRRRTALVEMRTAEKNRLQAGFKTAEVLKSIQSMIHILDKEIEELEKLMETAIAESPELSRLVELVDTITGISRLTAATVLVEVPPVLWTGRLAAVFAGVIPTRNSSGKTIKSSYMSKIGSSRLRHALYMPAISAALHNPVMRDFYHRLLKRGLKKKQALTAVMRKLLHLIFGIVKTGLAFDPKYEQKRKASIAV